MASGFLRLFVLRILRPKRMLVFSLFCLSLFLLQRVWETEPLLVRDCKSQFLSSPGNVSRPLVFAAFGRKLESGYLHHVFSILKQYGFEQGSISSMEWDLLWSHEYPFRVMKDQLMKLKQHQKVNHFPGSGYITNKVNLAVSNLPHVPKAFKIPDERKELENYVKENPDRLFVQKSNNHRGIKIQRLDELDLKTSGTFVQEYIHNPFLIDGHKFDIGMYTIITSIEPLRAYVYGDVLFRFCPEKYHPFDVQNVNKYVVGDDYLPVWEVDSLKKYYKDLGLGMKESFNAYVRSIGKDPNIVWQQVDESLRNLLLSRESALSAATSKFPSPRNFFEMIRVDFVIDEDLNVFIMEANMSPNLSSQHFPLNRLLYEQVIFNVLNLVGVIPAESLAKNSGDDESFQSEVAFKDLATFPEQCSICITNCSSSAICKLCKSCMTTSLKVILQESFREHSRKHLCRRIIPPAISSEEMDTGIDVEGLTEINKLMHMWFYGKCRLEHSWC